MKQKTCPQLFICLCLVLTSQEMMVPNSGHKVMGCVLKAFILSPFTRQVAGMNYTSPNDKNLVFLKELTETGKVRPVIDRTYPLHQTPDAFCYLEESHAQGKIVITIIEQRSTS